MMVWQEVLTVQKENRHEIVLSGNEISEKINKAGLDLTIFELTSLNYVNIHETSLADVPDEIQKLVNLQTLVLHSNKITRVPSAISHLKKLKVLDLSRNCLKNIPQEISELPQLAILNISDNQLEAFPKFSQSSKLTVLELSNNKLGQFPDVCYPDLANLSELRLSGNQIDIISDNIGVLTNLKVFHLNSNNVKVIPGELSDCGKLKELNLKDNPLSDKRLSKLIAQCHTKQVLDYIKQHCVRTSTVTGKSSKKGKKPTHTPLDAENSAEKKAAECTYKITVQHFTTDSLKIILKDDVKDVRPHIVACLILNLKFTEDTFKKFLQLQTKMHDVICDKRNAATIATHDWKKLGDGDLTYTALPPHNLLIKPLNRAQTVTGAQLFTHLQTLADNLRKEKKRNVYSGIHKYLYLIEGKPKYPCLLNSLNEVVSFPPITNSDTTKMSLETSSLLLEVTSATSQHICKKVADTVLKEMLPLFGKTLTVQQVTNVDIDGNLKSVYPSRSDLVYEEQASILVERE